MTRPKGSILVDELIFPIVDIYIDNGKIWFVAEVQGPVRAFADDSYVLCDRSGSVVYRSAPSPGRIDFPAVGGHVQLQFNAVLSLDDKTVYPRPWRDVFQ